MWTVHHPRHLYPEIKVHLNMTGGGGEKLLLRKWRHNCMGKDDRFVSIMVICRAHIHVCSGWKRSNRRQDFSQAVSTPQLRK